MSPMSRVLWVFTVCGCFLISNCLFSEEEKRPVYLTAAVGDYVVFNCDLDFPQDIVIPYYLLWRKEGKTVFSWYDGVLTAQEPYIGRIQLVDAPPRRYGQQGYGLGSVNLTSIRESDAGWFECRVTFPNRTPSSRNNGTWFYLTVNGGNLLAVPPINQTTLEGEEARFTCLTKKPDTIVTWYKDGQPLRDLDDLLHRSWVQDGTLTIHPTSMSDLGEYECEALNSVGERQTARAFLNITYKAKVIYAPREVYLPYGRSAILDCHFRANPPLTNLRWEKDGFLFDPYNVQGVFYRRNGSLYFSKVDEMHSGHYSCTPYNNLGTDGPSPSIHVVVQRSPVFIITPHNLYLRKLGETLQMPCDARDGEGGHKPTIVWYKKDGSPLPVGRYSIQDGNITIINIQEEDRGLYQCSATNEAATISAETELLVENIAPRAPYNLTANSSLNAVTLKWAAGRMRPEMEYSVWYRPVDTSEWRTLKIMSKKMTETIIPNLLPGREYEFMVLSQDRNGDGMFSKTLRIWTQRIGLDGEAEEYRSNPVEFVPVGPPRNVTVQLTSDGYLISWDPPGFGLESLRLYILRWTQGPREHLLGTAETKDTYFVVRNLEEDQTYNFQVIAMSMNDFQALSSKVELVVPATKKIQAVSMSIIVGIGFLILALVAVYFIKKKWCKSTDRKMSGK